MFYSSYNTTIMEELKLFIYSWTTHPMFFVRFESFNVVAHLYHKLVPRTTCVIAATQNRPFTT